MLSIDVDGTQLMLEHSLLSLSKWESIHEKPFFARRKDENRTFEEMISYFECMVVSPKNRTELIGKLDEEQHKDIVNYINASRTASTVNEIHKDRPGSRENVTSELIYYWMIAFEIPFSCETWHLNRLMMLIRICGVKQEKPKKRSSGSIASQYREMNAMRRRDLGSAG